MLQMLQRQANITDLSRCQTIFVCLQLRFQVPTSNFMHHCADLSFYA